MAGRKYDAEKHMNFKYGKKEMEYLKSRDRRLGAVIDRLMAMSESSTGLTDPQPHQLKQSLLSLPRCTSA